MILWVMQQTGTIPEASASFMSIVRTFFLQDSGSACDNFCFTILARMVPPLRFRFCKDFDEIERLAQGEPTWA